MSIKIDNEMTMDFYRTSEILPPSIQRDFRLKDDYLMTVLSASDFYR